MIEMMDDGEQGETGLCIEIYAMPDGTFTVSSAQKPAPTDGQPAASLDEALDLARQMVEKPTDPTEDAAMASAQAGYNRKAPRQMAAPSPEGIFGE